MTGGCFGHKAKWCTDAVDRRLRIKKIDILVPPLKRISDQEMTVGPL